MLKNQILVFTDGAASGNPGTGGWGSIVCFGDRVRELGGGESHTTNNRMELLALIRGLQAIRNEESINPIIVYSDSSYVLSGAEKNLVQWKNRNWLTTAGEPVKNQDLWQELDQILSQLQNQIIWTLVPGHSGIPGNERCDEIAVAFSLGEKISLYEGSLSNYKVDLSDVAFSKEKKNPWYLSFINGKLEKHKTWAECETRVKGQKAAKYKKVQSDFEEKKTLEQWGYKNK